MQRRARQESVHASSRFVGCGGAEAWRIHGLSVPLCSVQATDTKRVNTAGFYVECLPSVIFDLTINYFVFFFEYPLERLFQPEMNELPAAFCGYSRMAAETPGMF